MKETLSQNLIKLAGTFNSPLFVVGGAVRDYLINGERAKDVDLCSFIPVGKIIKNVLKLGGKITMQDDALSFVKFVIDEQKYEYTAFREEKYVSDGSHKPVEINFTTDIEKDAKRRDFTCNAVYYDVKASRFVDPLNGIEDIKNKVLRTVKPAEEVFAFDGERILRLARFIAELGFSADKETTETAKKFSDNVLSISGERIRRETEKILSSSDSHSYSPTDGEKRGLTALIQTGVAEKIFPELFFNGSLTGDLDVIVGEVKALKEDKIFALLSGVPFNQAEQILSRLSYGQKTVNRFKKFCIR